MAVIAVTTKMVAGVKYTHTTTDSADWGSVSNDTYFYDLDTELVYYKNGSGVVLEIFSATNGAGGSGTLNYIPKWTPDGSTLGNSIIQDNGTKLGIGSGVGASSMVMVTSTALNDLLYGFEVNNHKEASVTPSIGVGAVANGVATTSYNIGGHFIASNNTNGNFSLQLVDGSQDTGKFLKSITANGHANWATLNDITLDRLTDYGNSPTTNAFEYNCNLGASQHLDMQGSSADVTLTFANQVNGATYSLLVIQGTGLDNLILPSGYWLNDTVFNFSTELADNERAIITASRIFNAWYFAVKKVTYVA